MLVVGYIRVSRADGSQVLDSQKDALLQAGISSDRIYEDLASGRFDDRSGLATCIRGLVVEEHPFLRF